VTARRPASRITREVEDGKVLGMLLPVRGAFEPREG
jgi:hypothetical protein